MHRVLIVEDDFDIAEIMKINLSSRGYSTDIAYEGSEALDRVKRELYDMLLLDVILPDMTGIELVREIRGWCQSPVIFISCLDDSENMINAFRDGGDDYVVKPVNYDELTARIDAHIRRHKNAELKPVLKEAPYRVYKEFTIDLQRHAVIRGGEEIELSSTEYSLLLCLSSNPGELMLYEDLYRHVWNHDSLGDIRTVMVHISNLRKKIDPEKNGIIGTVRGAGYIFSGA